MSKEILQCSKTRSLLEPKALKGASQLKGTLMRVFCQSRDLICIFTSSPFFILPKTQGTLRHVMALSDLHGWKVISTSVAFNNFTIILQKLFCYWNIENKLVIYNDFPKCCWVPWFNICKALYFLIKFESEVSRVWCRLCTLYLKNCGLSSTFRLKKTAIFLTSFLFLHWNIKNLVSYQFFVCLFYFSPPSYFWRTGLWFALTVVGIQLGRKKKMKLNRVLGLLALSKACIVVKKKKNAVVFRFHTEALTFDFLFFCAITTHSLIKKSPRADQNRTRVSPPAWRFARSLALIISARSFPDLSLAGVAHGLISFPRAKKLVPKQW